MRAHREQERVQRRRGWEGYGRMVAGKAVRDAKKWARKCGAEARES